MKAAQINDYGDSSIIAINEIDKPIVGGGQVLIEVYAASLNPVDTAIRSGAWKDMMLVQFPCTLGGDVAGVVIEVADDVEGVAIGDKVYGQSMVISGGSGALAEYTATKPTQIAKMPATIDFKQAASLPLVASSALQALTQHINLQPGQKIFIHGGAGGIGTIAVQVAKHIGAYVAATATGEGIELVKQLGADEIIDYKNADFTTILKDYDAVLNLVGGDEFNKTLRVLKPGGVAVSLTGKADEALVTTLGVTALFQFTKVTTEILDLLTEYVDKGVVKPQVDKVYSLLDIKEAFDARETGTVRGKVVVQVKG